MKQLIVFCAFLVACGATTAGLRATFSYTLTADDDGYYDVPKTVTEAVSINWTLTDRPPGPYPQLVAHCYIDKIVCGLYDGDTGKVAGLQISLPQARFVNAVYDWGALGLVPWEPAVADGETITKYWTTAEYFVSEEFLAKDASERLASFNSSKTLQEDAVWVTGFNGNLVKIPLNSDELEAASFSKHGCSIGMGAHHYFNMSSELICSESTIFPWFPMTENGKLVAVGFFVFGNLPSVPGERVWFETTPRAIIEEYVITNGPECLYDLFDTPGLTSMHTYIVDDPWNITC